MKRDLAPAMILMERNQKITKAENRLGNPSLFAVNVLRERTENPK